MVTATAQYPVVAGIPYLRTGRDELRAEALAATDAGDERAALRLLLRDQDDWARTPPPSPEAVDEVIDGQVTLREAMALLGFGPVGDYFAYRWSDPTYLSGLALLEHFVRPGERVFELACGIGHYLRECKTRDIQAWGGDVVFAKLFLARRYMVPEADLVCFDAASPFPVRDGEVDWAFCHDAFYFLPDKAHVAREMQRVARQVIIGHAHNAAVDNYSAGAPLRVEEYAALLPGAQVFDDAELTRAWLEERRPKAGCDPEHAAAIALVWDEENEPLQLNPLLRKNASGGLDPQTPEFPSQRYRDEYGAASDYLVVREPVTPEAVRACERGDWTNSEELREFVRRRIFLSLPERW